MMNFDISIFTIFYVALGLVSIVRMRFRQTLFITSNGARVLFLLNSFAVEAIYTLVGKQFFVCSFFSKSTPYLLIICRIEHLCLLASVW